MRDDFKVEFTELDKLIKILNDTSLSESEKIIKAKEFLETLNKELKAINKVFAGMLALTVLTNETPPFDIAFMAESGKSDSEEVKKRFVALKNEIKALSETLMPVYNTIITEFDNLLMNFDKFLDLSDKKETPKRKLN